MNGDVCHGLAGRVKNAANGDCDDYDRKQAEEDLPLENRGTFIHRDSILDPDSQTEPVPDGRAGVGQCSGMSPDRLRAAGVAATWLDKPDSIFGSSSPRGRGPGDTRRRTSGPAAHAPLP